MLHVVTMFWDKNEKSQSFSHAYNETWVEKLYRGFARNLTVPFRFICFTDRPRLFAEAAIEQEQIMATPPTYACFTEPYKLNVPMILVGLDTIVVGNIDHFARHCLETATQVALPLDPYHAPKVCNGVALVPAGQKRIFDDWDRLENDMEWMRKQDCDLIDELFPGQVISYKKDVWDGGRRDPSALPPAARIVYFHGLHKPETLSALPWVPEHWR